MALPDPNTQETFDTTGIREDLSDLIHNISPTETPAQMLFGRGSATQNRHEWQMDELDAAADNAQPQGFDAVYNAVTPTVRVASFAQISTKAISITGTTEVVDKAGRNSELSYQLAKRAKELKRDMEFTMVGQTTTALMAGVAGSTGVAGRTPAVQAFFHADWVQGGTTLPGAHISRGATGADGGWDGATFDAPTDGTQRPFLESDLKGVIAGAWKNGGDPSVIMVGTFNKERVSSFTGNSTRYDRGEDMRLVAAIDVYVSDFGEHRVVPNRFQRDRDALVLTPELWSVDYLRSFRQHALAKTGDAEQRQLLVEWCVKGSNHAGSGIVADLTTS